MKVLPLTPLKLFKPSSIFSTGTSSVKDAHITANTLLRWIGAGANVDTASVSLIISFPSVLTSTTSTLKNVLSNPHLILEAVKLAGFLILNLLAPLLNVFVFSRNSEYLELKESISHTTILLLNICNFASLAVLEPPAIK